MNKFKFFSWQQGLRVVALLASLSVLPACEELLDEEPVNNLEAADALVTESGVDGLLTGLYNLAGQGAAFGTNYILVPDLVSGDIDWAGTFRGYIELSARNILITNSEAERTWNHAYRMISHANRILERSSTLPVSYRASAEGEARFFRALAYFYLIRFYSPQYSTATATQPNSGVPLFLTAVPFGTDPQSLPKPPRATLQAVVDQIVADLNSAKTTLPVTTPTSRSFFQRVTRGSASGLLARLYLDIGNFTAAASEASLVINSGAFALNTSTLETFLVDNTREALYEIQQNDQNNAGTANDGLATFYVSRGEAFANTAILAGIFSEPNDERRVGANRVVDGAGNVYKWPDPQRNYVVMRLAEMYLIRAEALLRPLAGTATPPMQALSDLNLIRTRSELPAVNPATVTAALSNVMQERRRELFLEGHHLFDLRRTGATLTLGNGRVISAAEFTLPIPQLEVQLSGIQQNALYR